MKSKSDREKRIKLLENQNQSTELEISRTLVDCRCHIERPYDFKKVLINENERGKSFELVMKDDFKCSYDDCNGVKGFSQKVRSNTVSKITEVNEVDFINASGETTGKHITQIKPV